jgi:hypothetical protein
VTASYNGNSQYAGNTSAPITQVVKSVTNTTTTMGSTPNPSTFGTAVTLTAAVTPSGATGSVQFSAGGVVLGSAALSNGTAALVTSVLPAGSDSIVASYGGDSNFAPSSSSGLTQVVNKANSTVQLSASPASQASAGQAVTFKASVSPAAATGSVQFLDGSAVLGNATVANGAAVFSTSTLSTGNHSITAVYSGDANVNGSRSSVLSYKIKPH